MMDALWTAAAGMNGQQKQVNTISNNLANINTTSYKQMRVNFEDAFYTNQKVSATPVNAQTIGPIPTLVGHGVKISSTEHDFSQGHLRETGVKTDVAISGQGYFQIVLPNGQVGYTRDGSFQVDASGHIVNANGYRLSPTIKVPQNYMQNSFTISPEGQISVLIPSANGQAPYRDDLGQIVLYNFDNNQGLMGHGDNVWIPSVSAGKMTGGTPGQNGMGKVMNGFLEGSNVSMAKQLVNMIVAQRAYQMNAKSVKTADSMLGVAVNLTQT